MTVEYRFTPKALAFAKHWSTPEAVMAQAVSEVDEMVKDGLGDPMDLIFHCIWIDGDMEKTFIVSPANDHMEIDVAVFEEIEMKEGPFAGKTVQLPSRGSE